MTASFENPAFADSLSLLAYMDGKVVGRIDSTKVCSHFDGSTKAYLDWICVIKSYRHRGVAQIHCKASHAAVLSSGRAEPLQPGAKAGNENNAKENVFMDEAITQKLFALQDETYQAFQSKLMPTVSPETIIGVRTPLLRKLAKELSGTARAEAFLRSLPHGYYEENNLHAFLVENIRDYDRALAETEKFLPYIDNWATCDCFCPKVFAKHKEELLVSIRLWLDSDRLYTVRYAMGMLMRYYLDNAFQPEYLAWVAGVHSEEYYLNMMRAWFFATALAKQPEETLPWLTERRLDTWTHNKTIQKAVESYRIMPEMKQQLRRLRIPITVGNR